MCAKSRADYFKLRRDGKKHFSALLDKSKVELIESILKKQKKTKMTWLEEKIDEELKKDDNV